MQVPLTFLSIFMCESFKNNRKTFNVGHNVNEQCKGRADRNSGDREAIKNFF